MGTTMNCECEKRAIKGSHLCWECRDKALRRVSTLRKPKPEADKVSMDEEFLEYLAMATETGEPGPSAWANRGSF